MKRIVEDLGVEVRERSVITRITPGKINHVETELGEIQAPIMVVALNAYGHEIGFFRNRVFPISVFQIATDPLIEKQWRSVGWQDRFGLSDLRSLFCYSVRTADDRIVIGGSDFTYYAFDALSSGNDKNVTEKIIGFGIWGSLGDKRGYKRVIEISNLILILGIGSLLLVNTLWALYLVFAVMSFAHSGEYIADQNFAMEFGSERDRPTYIGMSKTLTGPFFLLAPIIGGSLVQFWGYDSMFLAALILAIIAFMIIKFLVQDPRKK